MRSDNIAQLLPDVIRRTRQPGSVLDALLGAMEVLHERTEFVLEDFAQYVDPHRCPVEFVPYLAEWVGLGWLLSGDGTGFPTGDAPLRDLVASARGLALQRGTADGLKRMLELATGVKGIEVHVAPDVAYHIAVTCPTELRTYHELVALILKHEKPAFVTADLLIGDDAPVRLGPSNPSRTGEEPHA